ncbi:MAG: divalent-cation tolerance protein CutA [Alphaproteobacteria bacterium]|nr:divalent-cation tolerance protein CutA [Alphaproteobacteria bacterium]
MGYVTCASRDEALRIGRALVEERLAACVNIVDGMTALYRWQGKIEQGSEAILILKTRAAQVSALTARIKALHSYSVPCVVTWPLTQGNPDFLAWVETETSPP